MRLARFHFQAPRELFGHHLGMSLETLSDIGNHPTVWDKIDVIAGYDHDLIEAARWKRTATKKVVFRGHDLPSHWIGERRRVAPGVLARDGEDPYIRLSWRFPAISFDLDSTEMLLDRCPNCFRHLTWGGIQAVYRCQACSYDLRRATPMLARADTVAPTRRLAAAIGLLPGNVIEMPHPFDAADPVLALRILEWCGWFSGMMRTDGASHSVQNAFRGIEIATTWPAALELATDLLFRQNRTDNVERLALQSVLGKLPDPGIKKAALLQLSSILRRPEYQQRETFVPKKPRRPTYFRVVFKNT